MSTAPRSTPFRGLYAIIDLGACGVRDPLEVAEQVCAAGAQVVQLRAKRASGAEMLRVARRLAPVAKAWERTFIVNDRVDVALLADADGVHLGQDDLPVAAARRLLGPKRLIGLSTHHLAQVAAAQESGADYLGFGPVFATRTKDLPDPVVGLAGLAGATAASRLPVVAIGGITVERAASVRDAGAAAAAVISDLLEPPGPRERARAFLEAWG